MRNPGIAVVGVVGLGALVGAVVLATHTSGFKLPLPAGPAPKPKPKAKKPSASHAAVPVSKGEIPSHTVQVTQSAAAPQAAKRTVSLKPGKSYRAELLLTGIQTAASNDMVAAKLQELGPWKPLKVTGSDAQREATGTYAGKARTVALPNEVQSVTETLALPAVTIDVKGPTRVPPAAEPAAPPPALPPPPMPANPEQPAVAVARKPTQAAKDLYDYAVSRIKAGQGSTLGTNAHRNEIVHKAQIDMGGSKLNAALAKGEGGIYGPLTRARGKELLGREFPKA
jgi:hypothetical protein